MDRKKVYVYKMTTDSDYRGIAFDCHMHQRSGDNWMELWFAEGRDRGHMIEGEVVRTTENGFVFRSDGYAPGEWTFKELTLQDFKRKYFRIVTRGETLARVIKSTADLYEWFRKEYNFPID